MTDFLSVAETQAVQPGQVVVNVGGDVWKTWANANTLTGAIVGMALTMGLPGTPFLVVSIGRFPATAFNLGPGQASSIVAGNVPSRGNTGLVIGSCDASGEIFLTSAAVNTASVTTPIPSVTNVTALRTTGPNATNAVALLGYTIPNDGGGSFLAWNPSDTRADDGGTVFAVSGLTGRWNRIWTGPIDIRWFGAKQDNVTDDGPAINLAISAAAALGQAEVLIPQPNPTTYTRIATTVNLQSGIHLRGPGAQSRARIRHDPGAPNAVCFSLATGSLASGVSISSLIINTPNALATKTILLQDAVYWELNDLLIGGANLDERNIAIHIRAQNAIVPTAGFGKIKNLVLTSLESNAGWTGASSIGILIDAANGLSVGGGGSFISLEGFGDLEGRGTIIQGTAVSGIRCKGWTLSAVGNGTASGSATSSGAALNLSNSLYNQFLGCFFLNSLPTPTTLAGTFNASNGSATVPTTVSQVGVVSNGDLINFFSQSGTYYTVSSVSASQIVLTAPYLGTSAPTTQAQDMGAIPPPKAIKLDAGCVENVIDSPNFQFTGQSIANGITDSAANTVWSGTGGDGLSHSQSWRVLESNLPVVPFVKGAHAFCTDTNRVLWGSGTTWYGLNSSQPVRLWIEGGFGGISAQGGTGSAFSYDNAVSGPIFASGALRGSNGSAYTIKIDPIGYAYQLLSASAFGEGLFGFGVAGNYIPNAAVLRGEQALAGASVSNRNGGDARVRGGRGDTTNAGASGSAKLQATNTSTGNAIDIVTAASSDGATAQLGFYGTAAIAQQTRATSGGGSGQLTIPVGTPGTGTVDVGGAFSQTTLNNNFATIAARLNALEAIIHNLGLST